MVLMNSMAGLVVIAIVDVIAVVLVVAVWMVAFHGQSGCGGCGRCCGCIHCFEGCECVEIGGMVGELSTKVQPGHLFYTFQDFHNVLRGRPLYKFVFKKSCSGSTATCVWKVGRAVLDFWR